MTVYGQPVDFWHDPRIESACQLVDVWASVKWHNLLGCSGTPSFDWLRGTDERMIRLYRPERTLEEKQTDKKAGISLRRKHGFRFFAGTEEEWRKAQREGRTLTAETTQPSIAPGVLPYMRVCELAVAHVLGRLGSPVVLEGLLLHLYPRRGPYTRSFSEKADPYRSFRPLPSPLEPGHRATNAERRVYDRARALHEELVSANPHLVYSLPLRHVVGNMGGGRIDRRVADLLKSVEREFLWELAECGIRGIMLT